MALTPSESILLWFANIVRYLQSCPVPIPIAIEIEVRTLIESVGGWPWGRLTEIIMDIRKANVKLVLID